jgi:hypothetical protein
MAAKLAVVEPLHEALRLPVEFTGALEQGEVRSYVIVWQGTNNVMRWSLESTWSDKPMLVCGLLTVADSLRADVTRADDG